MNTTLEYVLNKQSSEFEYITEYKKTGEFVEE